MLSISYHWFYVWKCKDCIVSLTLGRARNWNPRRKGSDRSERRQGRQRPSWTSCKFTSVHNNQHSKYILAVSYRKLMQLMFELICNGIIWKWIFGLLFFHIIISFRSNFYIKLPKLLNHWHNQKHPMVASTLCFFSDIITVITVMPGWPRQSLQTTQKTTKNS